MHLACFAVVAADSRKNSRPRTPTQRRPPPNPRPSHNRPHPTPLRRRCCAAGRRTSGAPPPLLPRNPRLPSEAPDKWNDAHSVLRGQESRSFAWLKLLAVWLLFLIWVKSADWVNRDTQIFDLGYGTWNPIIFFPFLLVLLLFTVSLHSLAIYFWLRARLAVRGLSGDVRAVRGDAQ